MDAVIFADIYSTQFKTNQFLGLFTSNVNIWQKNTFGSNEQSFIFGEWVDFVVKEYIEGYFANFH